MSSERPAIGISSCLLGSNVRYDGGQRLEKTIVDSLGPHVRWVPVCPEADCGLGVPRPPMRLVSGAAGTRIVEIGTGADHTERLLTWMDEALVSLKEKGVSGFVFKARSPSCGLRDAEIESDGRVTHGPGLFASAVISAMAGLPASDEEGLRTPETCMGFLESALKRRKGLES